MKKTAKTLTHKGGCHCGAVKFEVSAPARVTVDECNCSICRATGFLHLIVDKADFRLIEGGHDLTDYRFNTGTARHLFCSVCGVKSFYVPRSHPDGVSVNYRCLDQSGFKDVTTKPFDGENWEDSIGELRARDDG